MKDKILKLFFDEELVLVREDDKADKDALYIVHEDDVNWIVRFFKYTNIFFLIHHIPKQSHTMKITYSNHNGIPLAMIYIYSYS